ncbi:glycerophosphodiester phosphodiesterase family protein [Candidatus Thiodiazotropha sp. LNASS1]|uniref:glycerophosphodiester phosphodiesterase family protein n=1 Tax=Candidatus Thiodiazotropha sp. LNASS1 TaxID=3096260 RepID=UPI0034777F77
MTFSTQDSDTRETQRNVSVAADRPLVIGHRGACGYLPEHTLASYRLAIRMGVDFIEPDLVLTRDHRLIARHDNELSLTTDVAQHPEFADRYTTKQVDGMQREGWFCEDFELSEIKTLGIRWSDPDSREWRELNEAELGIPTLEEVIALVRQEELAHGLKIGIYPETKYPTYYAFEGGYLDGSPIHKSISRILIEVLQREAFTAKDRVFIQSFEIANLIELHDRIMPSYNLELPLIQLFGDIKGELTLPEGDFSRPYDFVYHHNRGDDLEHYYGDLTSIATVVSQLNYQLLTSPAAIDWMVNRYASGIATWLGSLMPTLSMYNIDSEDSNTTGYIDSVDRGTVPPYIEHALNRGMHVHVFPLCEHSSTPQTGDGAWREGLKSEAIHLFNQGVDGIFFNLPDIGVEAKRHFLLR